MACQYLRSWMCPSIVRMWFSRSVISWITDSEGRDLLRSAEAFARSARRALYNCSWLVGTGLLADIPPRDIQPDRIMRLRWAAGRARNARLTQPLTGYPPLPSGRLAAGAQPQAYASIPQSGGQRTSGIGECRGRRCTPPALHTTRILPYPWAPQPYKPILSNSGTGGLLLGTSPRCPALAGNPV